MRRKAAESIDQLQGLERRVFILILNGRFGPSDMAERLGVSKITAVRAVGALRSKGIKVATVRESGNWYYEVREIEGYFRGRWHDALVRHQARFAKVPVVENQELAGMSVDEVVHGLPVTTQAVRTR